MKEEQRKIEILLQMIIHARSCFLLILDCLGPSLQCPLSRTLMRKAMNRQLIRLFNESVKGKSTGNFHVRLVEHDVM